jgi:CheY-like chemotaxis protein/anti-sigma regulatory factor (Ser/Thr protein kinase)
MARDTLISSVVSSHQVSSSKQILIVDDDPVAHELLTAMLRAEGRDIDHASDGQEALAQLLARPYDLVLTDIHMPGMDGLTLLQRIREVRPETAVVVMTAESTPEHVVDSIRQQAYSYLSKPLSSSTVRETVFRALSRLSDPGDIEVSSARPGWISLQLRCKMDVAERLTQFFSELGADLSTQERDDVCTAFRELLMNAIEHGGHSDPEQKVSLTYVRTARSIIYYIRDPGEGFSFDKLQHAAISNPEDAPFEHAELRAQLGIRPGGFGILLTRKFADEVLYSQKGNEVLLIKYLA